MFSSFSPNESGAFPVALCRGRSTAVVQPGCISSEKFAHCEIADRLRSPTARLGWSFVCTAAGIAQKKRTKPVGGRGISAFYSKFFFKNLFWDCPLMRNSLYKGDNAGSNFDDMEVRE
jgi:hypothetical protein